MSKRNAEEQRCEKELEIQNELGLHARPAAMFVKLANKFVSDIFVAKGEEQVNGKSIMGVMMLAAGKGTLLKITAVGSDAEAAIAEFEKLLKSKFGED